MSLGFEVNLCRHARDAAMRFYASAKFGLPFPDLPNLKKYLVARPLTGKYEVIKVESLGTKIVATHVPMWLVDVELFLKWSDNEEEMAAVHRVWVVDRGTELTPSVLHRVPYVGWDANEIREFLF